MPADPGSARDVDLGLLIADLCGYTALTETHGGLRASGIVLQFERLAEASLEPGVAIINSVGDAVFCAGADPLAVVRTALRLREAVEREPEFPNVRIGVHFGQIVERERRLFGAPINLTARVAAHARGGQVLCTESITHAVRGRGGFELRPLGETRFRNVAYPVAVFELTRSGALASTSSIDPVCRMQVEVDRAAATIDYAGSTYCFCSAECARMFAEAPQLYVETG